MKNTILQNIIANFQTMENDHFISWFNENQNCMLDQEKQQIIDAYERGTDEGLNDGGEDCEDYYNNTFTEL